ncbi:LPXTG cell wall anchor domain-containing protein [Fontibacillus phaseoli]|uniref:LPXTG cell wall anchor domain-containing protein n=1 Tax=Fontibacillus phaseoli TaxID=1416533 RepID=UPI0015F093E2
MEPPGPGSSPDDAVESKEGAAEIKTLPKTGENSSLPFYIIGSAITALGIIFRKTAKRN